MEYLCFADMEQHRASDAYIFIEAVKTDHIAEGGLDGFWWLLL